ncbi:MAG: MarR family transcriptional regulator [Bacteroidetes bacterium]|nr:MarR family transcriptional regulator [Bacteroidota bacterium]
MELEKEIKQDKFRSVRHKMMLNIIFTANWFMASHGKSLKKYGITPEQFNILRILRGQRPKPATVNLLMERMLNKMSNVSRLVEKLRLKGYVNREICSEDRRACNVFITTRGLELLEKIDKLEKEWLGETNGLSEKEAIEVNRLLNRLRG